MDFGAWRASVDADVAVDYLLQEEIRLKVEIVILVIRISWRTRDIFDRDILLGHQAT